MAEDNNSFIKASNNRKGALEYKKKEIGVINGAESVLNVFSWLILFGGILVGSYYLVDSLSNFYSKTSPLVAIAIIIGSVVNWAVFQVFINISNSLKNINNGIKVFFQKDLDDIDKIEKERKETEKLLLHKKGF